MGEPWEAVIEKVLEVQAGVGDVRPAPSFQWFPQQWLADANVLLMNWTARAMHFHLLQIAWQQSPPCSIPEEEGILMGWCNHPSAWREGPDGTPGLWSQISRGWKLYKGRWWQIGLCRSYLRQMEVRVKRSASAKSRWGLKDANASSANANAADEACKSIPFALQMQCSSSSSTSTTTSLSTSTTTDRERPTQRGVETEPEKAAAAADRRRAQDREEMEGVLHKMREVVPDLDGLLATWSRTRSGGLPKLAARAAQLRRGVIAFQRGDATREQIRADIERTAIAGWKAIVWRSLEGTGRTNGSQKRQLRIEAEGGFFDPEDMAHVVVLKDLGG